MVIIGGGFGGLNAAQGLASAQVQVTLIDRRNFHLFQPLLYQVATGALSPANIAAPLRAVLKKQRNTEVVLGEVVDIDPANRRVSLSDGMVEYDTLVLATGSTHHYFGHPEWEFVAPGLKTIEDATEIRRRILRAFEAAEQSIDERAAAQYMTFVVVGGGPTGVEMAGAIGELARQTLRRDFRRIDTAKSRILLVEGTDRVLPPYRPKLSAKAQDSLQHLGVEVRTGAFVTDIKPGVVTIQRDGTTEDVPAHTVIWAAGVAASPLGRMLADKLGVQVDRQGRVPVNADLTVANHPEIFVIGDLAAVQTKGDSKATLPGVAPVAIQQGRFVAATIRRRLAGEAPRPFVYHDHGNMATIGRAAAVADLGWLTLSGYLAWLTWLFVHLLYLVSFQSRILVLIQWAWSYFTRNRAARLITNEGKTPVVMRNDTKN
ncbi:MAG: NAD(P)/FAD-dependent oxidoreductase [Gemmataceae bacterium]